MTLAEGRSIQRNLKNKEALTIAHHTAREHNDT